MIIIIRRKESERLTNVFIVRNLFIAKEDFKSSINMSTN